MSRLLRQCNAQHSFRRLMLLEQPAGERPELGVAPQGWQLAHPVRARGPPAAPEWVCHCSPLCGANCKGATKLATSLGLPLPICRGAPSLGSLLFGAMGGQTGWSTHCLPLQLPLIGHSAASAVVRILDSIL